MWRAPVNFVARDVASTGTLYGALRGKHRYTMRRVTRRAPVHYEVVDVASTVQFELADSGRGGFTGP